MKEKEGNCESLGFVWFFCSISLISSRVSDATENSRNRRSHVTEKISGCESLARCRKKTLDRHLISPYVNTMSGLDFNSWFVAQGVFLMSETFCSENKKEERNAFLQNSFLIRIFPHNGEVSLLAPCPPRPAAAAAAAPVPAPRPRLRPHS